MPARTLDEAYSTTKRQRLESLFQAMKNERSTFEAHWRELGEYFLPRRTRFTTTDRNKGDKRNQKIINSAGRFAARTLQSGLHAGLTSPARPWFKLGTPDPTLAERDPVREWLHITAQRMYTVFSASNLYNALPIVYGDLGVFGTAAVGILPDDQDVFRAHVYPIGTYALGIDARNRVSSFAREYELTVRQVVEQFGGPEGRRALRKQEIDWSGISSFVKNAWDRGEYETAVPLVWMVTPNEDHDPRRLESRFLPFKSCYWETGARGNEFLREGGFKTFPILAPRWDVTGEDTWGVACPGMDALPDQKMLQVMEKEKAKAVAKQVNPPVTGPSALKTQKVSLISGDITYVDVREGMQGLRAIHEVNLNLEHLAHDMARTEYRISRAFFEDLFLMLAQSDPSRGTQPITAREVEERHEEKLLALGPVLERTNDELLEPLIDRAYLMMNDLGMVPTPPEELDGIDLKVEFISIMAQAQKYVGVASLDRFLGSTVPLAQFMPGIMDNIDERQVVENYSEMLGGDPRIVRSEAEVQKIIKDRAEQQQQLQQAEVAQKTTAAAKNLGETTLRDGSSALDAVLNG
jgi:hypothetical protein